jgi:hypothetical protein
MCCMFVSVVLLLVAVVVRSREVRALLRVPRRRLVLFFLRLIGFATSSLTYAKRTRRAILLSK